MRKRQYSKLELLNTCYEIAENAFLGKVNLAGKPYFSHLTSVALKVKEFGGTAVATALLHDLLEDCDAWSQSALLLALPNYPSSKKIVDYVLLLTHNKKDLTYEEYISRLINSKKIIPLQVKKADLEDNMDLTRILFLTDKDVRRIIKYHTAWVRVSAAIKELEKNKYHEHN